MVDRSPPKDDGKGAKITIVDRDGRPSKNFHRPSKVRTMGGYGAEADDMVVRNAGSMGMLTGEYGRITDQIRNAAGALREKRKK